ncbi:MAG: hypothetical protein JNL60_08150 [Bacteroidia bacterium]|nr:hypothetical protein [Bacteroidia bacterium]
MKALFLIAAASAMLSLGACKKDYTCECVRETAGGNTETESSNTGKMKRSDAEAKCNDGDKTEVVLGETYTTECSLK